MFLGITILGWIIIAAVYGPLLIAFALLRRRIGGARAQAPVLAVLLLPLAAAVAEAVYIDWRFRSLCKESGVRVTKRVTAAGYLDRTTDWSKWPDDFLKSGFQFIEWTDSQAGSYRRIERSDGSWTVREQREPTAQYVFSSRGEEGRINHAVLTKRYTMTDTGTGERLGEYLIVYRYPAALDRLWWRYFDAVPEMCPSIPVGRDLVRAVLVPMPKTEGQ